MDTKKYVTASVVVWVVYEVLSFLIHQVILGGTYQAEGAVWRSAPNLPILLITGLIFSFLFVFIFTKGYEGKGIPEGVRYGLWIGLLMSIPMAFNTYATLPISLGLAIQWLIYGVIQLIIAGIVAAALYKPAMPEAS